jgi:uncharacterized protein (DUF1778 family)
MVTSGDIRIRISESQKDQLRNLAEANGFRTLSDFCRSKIFDNDLAMHTKINEILQLLN